MGLSTHLYIGPIMLIHDWDHSRPECIHEISEDGWDESLYISDIELRVLPDDLKDTYILIPNSNDVGIHVNTRYESVFLDIDEVGGGHSIDVFKEVFAKEIATIEDRNLGRVEIINRFILYFS